MPNKAERRKKAHERRRLAAMAKRFVAAASAFPSGVIRCEAGPETRAQFVEAAAGSDGRKLKTFRGIAYTGGTMKVGYGRPVAIDLDGLKAGSDVLPFLRDHDATDIVGHGTADIGKRQIKVDGTASGEGETDGARRVLSLAANGFPWQMSVGVEPIKVEAIDAGDSVVVNGRTVTGPAYVVRAGLLREVSFVAIGADGRTSAEVAAMFQGGPMNFEEWVKAKWFDVATLTDVQRKSFKAMYDAEIAAAAADPEDDDDETDDPTQPVKATGPKGGNVDIEAIVARAVTAAVSRVNESAEVASLLASFEHKLTKEKFAEIRAAAAKNGWGRDKVELECRREARPDAPSIHTNGSNAVNAAALEVALMRAGGIAGQSLERQFRPEVLEASDAPRYRNMTLHKLLGLVCEAGGVYVTPGDKEALVQGAFESHRKLLTFDAFSTLSLSGILGNTANKSMLSAYGAVPVTWNKIAAVRSHSDFKINTLYQLTADGAFKKVGANGELKLSTLQETSYTKQLSTYGTIIALTRRDLVNDDLGAFMQVTGTLGRLAALRIEEAVYVLLLSKINDATLFHANNGNYQTGAGALSITTLASLAGLFDNQVDTNEKPVLVKPRYLLTGSTIRTIAENLYKETVVIGSTTADKPVPARNPHAGLYEPVSSPYVNNTRIKDQDGAALTGQTSTGFGLFADPADRAALGVAFLNGAQTPTIQSGELDFSQLGMQWRGFLDFGTGVEDPAGAAWSTGT